MFGRRRSDTPPATGPNKVERAYASFLNSRAMNSPATYRAALVFMVAIVGLALYLVIAPSPTTEGAAIPADSPAPTTAVVPKELTPDSSGLINGCGPQDATEVSPELVVDSQFDTTWTPIGQMSVPSSEVGGPWIPGAQGHCFNRNPEGAIYAMATFIAERAQTTTNEAIVDVMKRRCLQDANFEAYTARLLSGSPVTGEPVIAIDGYRWMEYTPQRAQVELRFKRITGVGAGTTATNVFSVIWMNNDWLVLVPNPDSPTRVPGDQLRTFHVWGANG